MMKKKFKIFLGDLNYINEISKFNLYVPLNIGYIASYLKRKYGQEVEIVLFKDPSKFLDQTIKEKPDVVGLSFYFWNTYLNHSITKQIRRVLKDDVTIIWGGASVDSSPSEIKRLFSRFPEVDAFIPDEGELGFSSLVNYLLKDKIQDLSEPIDGVALMEDGELVLGRPVGLSMDLSQIGSPYLDGILDPFLETYYQPLLQTSRLCPYTCTFCTSGKNQGKLRAFSMEQVIDEIDFISSKFADRPHFPLWLSDENFGILKRDVHIAEHMRKLHNKKSFPRSIFLYNDKKFGETTRSITEILGDITVHGLVLSLQTENPDALKEIKRSNLSSEQLDKAIKLAAKLKIPATTELIFGLPNETRKSFTELLNRSVERGFDSVAIHNLFVVDGIEMNRLEYREKCGLKTKFRQLMTNYGQNGNEFTSEAEEVVVESEDFSFEDFLIMRGISMMFYVIFYWGHYRWFFKFVQEIGIPMADFLTHFVDLENIDKNNKEWRTLISDYYKMVNEELFSSPEELNNHLKEVYKSNDKKVMGDSRINVIFAEKLIYRENKSWMEKAFISILEKYVNKQEKSDIFLIAKFLLKVSAVERVDLLNEKIPEPILTEWDIISWKNDKYKNSLTDYHVTSRHIRFKEHPDFKQKIERVREMFPMADQDIYIKAMDYITPRTQTLYNLYYE